MSKKTRIRSRKKHDEEIFRHFARGDTEKALKTIAKDPDDSILKFYDRKIHPMLKERRRDKIE
jgi:hypothetical protein